MKSSLLATVAAASLFLVNGFACAQDIIPHASTGLYVSVFAGASLPNRIDGTYQLSSTAISYSSNLNLKSGVLAGGAIGVQVNDLIRADVEVSHASWKGDELITRDDSGNLVDSKDLNGRLGATFVLGNAWLDWKNDSAFTPYAGGGAGIGWINSHKDDLFGDSRGTDFAFQLGAGVKYSFSDHLSVDVGYRYRRILNVDVDYKGFLDDFEKGDFASHNFLLGISYSL